MENNSITGHTVGAGLVAECFRTQNQRSGELDVVFRGNSCTNSTLDLPNGFNANLTPFPQLDFGNPPGTGACSILPLV